MGRVRARLPRRVRRGRRRAPGPLEPSLGKAPPHARPVRHGFRGDGRGPRCGEHRRVRRPGLERLLLQDDPRRARSQRASHRPREGPRLPRLDASSRLPRPRRIPPLRPLEPPVRRHLATHAAAGDPPSDRGARRRRLRVGAPPTVRGRGPLWRRAHVRARRAGELLLRRPGGRAGGALSRRGDRDVGGSSMARVSGPDGLQRVLDVHAARASAVAGPDRRRLRHLRRARGLPRRLDGGVDALHLRARRKREARAGGRCAACRRRGSSGSAAHGASLAKKMSASPMVSTGPIPTFTCSRK
jgi:hypothetical protein